MEIQTASILQRVFQRVASLRKNEPKKLVQPKLESTMKDELSELKQKLKKHHGSMTRIANKVGVTYQYVYMILNSKRPANYKIIKAATEVISEMEKEETRKKQLQKIEEEELKNLIAQV